MLRKLIHFNYSFSNFCGIVFLSISDIILLLFEIYLLIIARNTIFWNIINFMIFIRNNSNVLISLRLCHRLFAFDCFYDPCDHFVSITFVCLSLYSPYHVSSCLAVNWYPRMSECVRMIQLRFMSLGSMRMCVLAEQ